MASGVAARSRLRLLGSLAEAEDLVQETYARWYTISRHEQEAIGCPGAC